MNKLAYYEGYMCSNLEKTAEKLTGPMRALLGTAVLGIPGVAGYYAGKAHAGLTSPSDTALDNIQAEYVKKKFQQAIDDLASKKKIEDLKEKNLGNTNTLRI